jgi:hypothetical protein
MLQPEDINPHEGYRFPIQDCLVTTE